MTGLFLAIILTSSLKSGPAGYAELGPLSYRLAVGKVEQFEVAVGFQGYLPLLGGKDGEASVEMKVNVAGEIPEEKDQVVARSEIESIKVMLAGSELPLAKSNIETFFPPSSLTINSVGKVLKNTAPKVRMPVRLPGLDSQRLPDITWLPIMFSEAPLKVGDKYSFPKSFGGSDVTYTVTLTEMKDGIAKLDIALNQETTDFEDAFRNPVDTAEKAKLRVETLLTGSGRATFDSNVGLFRTVNVTAVSKSKVIDLKTKKESSRQLKTTLNIKLVRPTPTNP